MASCGVFVAFLLISTAASFELIGFEDAEASSTYPSGLEFSARQGIASGTGYWLSTGSHSASELVTWTGELSARRKIKGVKIQWQNAPGEVQILTSADGSNFEIAKEWAQVENTMTFEHTISFPNSVNAMDVIVEMRAPRKWGFFGISEVVAIAADNEPLMLINGAASQEEVCLAVDSTEEGAAIVADSCMRLVAQGKGAEVFEFNDDNQIMSTTAKKCVSLERNSATNGGTLSLRDCQVSLSAGDGRSSFSLTQNAQLQLKSGCVTVSGDSALRNVASGSTAYTSSGEGKVEYAVELEKLVRVSEIEISWTSVTKKFTVETSSGGRWTEFASVRGNLLKKSVIKGDATTARRIRVVMEGDSSSVAQLNVYASSLKPSVAACTESPATKFSAYHVDAFNPTFGAAVKSEERVLKASVEQLGELISDLEASKSCGKKNALKTDISLLQEGPSGAQSVPVTIPEFIAQVTPDFESVKNVMYYAKNALGN